MTSSADRFIHLIKAKTPAPNPVYVGTFVSASGSDVVVNIGDASITVPSVGLTSPTPGMAVRLMRNESGRLVVIGPAAPQSLGTVVEDEAVAPPKPKASTVTYLKRTTAIRATNSGKFYHPSSVWDKQDVHATVTSGGAWFYGTRVKDYLKGATITSIEIYLPLEQSLGVAYIGYHGYGSKPAGWVGSGGLTYMNHRSGWVTLPLSVATYLKANVGGIVVTSGNGLNRWKGTKRDSMSGALRFTGRRG